MSIIISYGNINMIKVVEEKQKRKVNIFGLVQIILVGYNKYKVERKKNVRMILLILYKFNKEREENENNTFLNQEKSF